MYKKSTMDDIWYQIIRNYINDYIDFCTITLVCKKFNAMCKLMKEYKKQTLTKEYITIEEFINRPWCSHIKIVERRRLCDNKKHGPYSIEQCRYTNYKFLEYGTFLNDELNGQQIIFDKYGNVESIYTFIKGIKNGFFKIYSTGDYYLDEISYGNFHNDMLDGYYLDVSHTNYGESLKFLRKFINGVSIKKYYLIFDNNIFVKYGIPNDDDHYQTQDNLLDNKSTSIILDFIKTIEQDNKIPDSSILDPIYIE